MRTRWFFLILCVAFLLRVVAAIYWQRNYCGENAFFFGDSQTYWELARSIAESVRSGDWKYEWSDFHWQIFRTPGYPAILAPLFLVFGDSPPIFAARLIGAVLGTATVAAVAGLSRILFRSIFNDERKANLAVLFTATVVAVEPCQILTSILVLSEAPFCLFMLLQIALWIRAMQIEQQSQIEHALFRFTAFAYFALSGLFYAVAVYCRPSWLYFVPFAFLFHCVWGMGCGIWGVGCGVWGKSLNRNLSPSPIPSSPHPTHHTPHPIRSRWISGYVIIIMVFVLAMLPWWIRNYNVSGRFVATSLQMGPSLYDGLSPKADGSSQMDFVDAFREEERIAEEELRKKEGKEGKKSAYLRDTYEYRVDQRMKKAAIDWAKSHPDRVLELALIKVVRLWNLWPNEPSFSSFPVRIVIFFTYVPIMFLAICGAIATRKSGFAFWLCWIPAIYFTLLHVIFVSSLRYRIPPMLLLIVLAGGFFARFWKENK